MKSILTLVATVLLLCSNTTSTDDEYEILKIIDLQRKPVIEGVLNGKKAYFLLDTGSDMTILNLKDAKKYKFNTKVEKRQVLRVSGFGGTSTDILLAKDVDFQLGSQRIFARFMSYDLSNVIYSMQKTTGIKISGIIGSDIMIGYRFKIDYESRVVALVKRDKK